MIRLVYKKEDIPFIKLACAANGYAWTFTVDEETEEEYVLVDADEEKREEFLEDIECEKKSAEWGGIPVYSAYTILNRKKLRRFQAFNHSTAFAGLDEKAEKILLNG